MHDVDGVVAKLLTINDEHLSKAYIKKIATAKNGLKLPQVLPTTDDKNVASYCLEWIKNPNTAFKTVKMLQSHRILI